MDLSELFQNILSGNFEELYGIFGLVISIAIYSVIIWHFYRFIARRDCFKISEGRHPKLVGFFKYFFIFPFVAIIFFLGFSILMLFLTRGADQSEEIVLLVLSTSFAIVMAIRITSYYSEDLSKDVAKMLPFALLGIFLVDPSYFNFDVTMSNIYSIPDHANSIAGYIFFIIIIEWILRGLLALRYAIIPKKTKVETEKS